MFTDTFTGTFAYFGGTQEWLIIGIVVLVLFGGTKIPSLPRAWAKVFASSKNLSRIHLPVPRRRKRIRRKPNRVQLMILASSRVFAVAAAAAVFTARR
jgi:hypothetical protein